jgi:tRNA-specific 2-thiouridylase
MKKNSIKAVALVSSGLDSLLAAKIVKDMGIDVQGVCFIFQFDHLEKKFKNGAVESLFQPLGIPITAIDISEEYLPILKNPKHGFGSAVNPCIDCHLYMLKRAKEIMDESGCQFLITGEVVGQRPMSQTKPTLFHMNKVLGFKDLILRPLSAKLLPPTLPENEGWVDRERLYGISGRSRKPQLALTKELGITHFSAPAGGCILTDPNYARRVKAFFEHRGKEDITVEELKLMRVGRHFWPNSHLQVIVGRDESDNLALEPYRKGRWAFYPENDKGPLVLASGIQDEADKEIAAGITARYCSGNDPSFRIIFEHDVEKGELQSGPVSDDLLDDWRV